MEDKRYNEDAFRLIMHLEGKEELIDECMEWLRTKKLTVEEALELLNLTLGAVRKASLNKKL